MILFTFSPELFTYIGKYHNKISYSVLCDVVHRLHPGVLYIQKWFHSIQVNVTWFIPIKTVQPYLHKFSQNLHLFKTSFIRFCPNSNVESLESNSWLAWYESSAQHNFIEIFWTEFSPNGTWMLETRATFHLHPWVNMAFTAHILMKVITHWYYVEILTVPNFTRFEKFWKHM